MLFFIIFSLVIVQRLAEVWVAKRNEKLLRAKGAYEVGASHYPYMVALHVSFFMSLLVEVLIFKDSISPLFLLLFIIFLLVQGLRVWCLHSLGTFWNTKIIILPGADSIKKGPYRYISHPNYVIVCIEILLLPLMFQAYATAVVFTLLNAAMLFVRITVEEKALMAYKKSPQ